MEFVILAVVGVLAVAGVAGSARVVSRDGYRRIPDAPADPPGRPD